jgi:cytoplasmic iron level regulating protein YaaA (DUF328/UPF0246 family)
MLIVISPAKSYSKEVNAPELSYTQPDHLDSSEKLIGKLRGLSKKKFAGLMNLSDDLAIMNMERHQNWQPPFSLDNAAPAIYAFRGEVYIGLDSKTMSNDDIIYAEDHLRILSGLYGCLRPLDLIQPYRLEMGAKLKYFRKNNLYQFWGDEITKNLNEVLVKEKVLVNLASTEYFKAVDTKKIKGRIITPVFRDLSNGEYKSLMTYAKRARGLMSRYIIQERVEEPELLKSFNSNGYCYSPEMSDEGTFVFIRG